MKFVLKCGRCGSVIDEIGNINFYKALSIWHNKIRMCPSCRGRVRGFSKMRLVLRGGGVVEVDNV